MSEGNENLRDLMGYFVPENFLRYSAGTDILVTPGGCGWRVEGLVARPDRRAYECGKVSYLRVDLVHPNSSLMIDLMSEVSSRLGNMIEYPLPWTILTSN